MCNHCSDHAHTHSNGHHPEIVQIMPANRELYAVYTGESRPANAVQEGKGGIFLVPVLFMGLIRHGEKTMVEGFFASDSINSCEDVHGFRGYAASLADAEKLYA